jgi:hypothetical protein
MRRVAALAMSIALSAAAAAAGPGDVRLSMSGGRVSIAATDATVAEILAEWGRVGQTKVVNADALPSDRVTIELTDVSEEQALAVLLRKASGYLAAPRMADAPGVSRFDRIMVMRASAAPPPRPAAPAAAMPAPLEPPVADAADGDADASSAGDQSAADPPANDTGAAATESAQAVRPRAPAVTAALRAREREAARGDASVAAALAARAKADASAGGDGHADGDVEPPVEAQMTPAPRGPVPAVPAPPARPMPAGQMTERRANQAPRDRAVVQAPQTPSAPADLGDPTILAPGELVPTDPALQEAYKQRRATETVDPRTYKVQLPAPGVAPPVTGAAKPGVVAPKGPGQS